MKKTLILTIATPLSVVLSEDEVVSVRAEDDSGSFGVWPDHADFLTAIGAAVLHWRIADGGWRYCALRGGVFRISGGRRVDVACREAVLGDDLTRLEAQVRAEMATQDDAARRVRGEQMRLHAVAIRRLMRQFGPESDGSPDALLGDFR